jgi:hypothetical protein
MMTTTRQGASGHHKAPDSAFDDEQREGTSDDACADLGAWQPDPHFPEIRAAAGGSRRKRRKRSTRGKHRRSQVHGHSEGVNREHIFQELEGLLRQIREEAEESSNRATEEVSAMARTVTTFTRELEEQSGPVSERLRSEYQRIREMLTQALRGER